MTLASPDDTASERVILDPNQLDNTGGTAIDFYQPSTDGKYVAVSLSQGGSESGDVHVYRRGDGQTAGRCHPASERRHGRGQRGLERGWLGLLLHALPARHGAAAGRPEFLSAGLLSPPRYAHRAGHLLARQRLPAHRRDRSGRFERWPLHPGARWPMATAASLRTICCGRTGNGARLRCSPTKFREWNSGRTKTSTCFRTTNAPLGAILRMPLDPARACRRTHGGSGRQAFHRQISCRARDCCMSRT